MIVTCLPPFKLLLDNRRGSSADRAAGSFDTFPLRPHGAARLQSYQSRVDGGANPRLHRRWTTWTPRSKVLNDESTDQSGGPRMGIHVRNDVVGTCFLSVSNIGLMVERVGGYEPC